MDENENDEKKYQQIKKTKYILPKLENLNNDAINILNEGLLGDELVEFLKKNSDNILGSDLLIVILSKINDHNNINWILKKEYGASLKFLLENNLEDQFKCLLIIQQYCQKLEFPKIKIKESQPYLIKMIYQLLFTNEIIDESIYNNWIDNIDNIEGLTEKVRNTLLIQTTDFFMILKTVFVEGDEDEENQENNDNKEELEINKIPKDDSEDCKEIIHKQEDEIENEDFTLDDL